MRSSHLVRNRHLELYCQQPHNTYAIANEQGDFRCPPYLFLSVTLISTTLSATKFETSCKRSYRSPTISSSTRLKYMPATTGFDVFLMKSLLARFFWWCSVNEVSLPNG